jgi:NAD(P)-dependent dehydrogenase (short-subunit alcohol dehydrogenase family)
VSSQLSTVSVSYAGYFEELTPAQVEAQLAVTLLEPMNVTRAVLPVMRRQRSGRRHGASSRVPT